MLRSAIPSRARIRHIIRPWEGEREVVRVEGEKEVLRRIGVDAEENRVRVLEGSRLGRG